MSISVVITAHNEGEEVRRTLQSVRGATRGLLEIILVDDASTDGSCAGIEGDEIRLLPHARRLGVAPRGTLVQALPRPRRSLSPTHISDSVSVASTGVPQRLLRNAIVWPDVCGIDDGSALFHGARFRFRPKRGFYARWNLPRPVFPISRISSLKTPGYVMPRSIYDRVRWPQLLRGWGGSEAAVSLKAFFLGIPLLHLCGPLARHLFKKSFHYEVDSQGVSWNQAVIARVCFNERTWHEHWLPNVFAKELPESILSEFESPAIRDEQREFQRRKVRSDRDFWRWLLKVPEPSCLRRTSVVLGCGKVPSAVRKSP